METLKKTIEKNIGKQIELVSANDGANLLFTATIEGLTVANVYKSFNKNFKPIVIIRYTKTDY